MWRTLFLNIGIVVGSRNLVWPTVIGLINEVFHIKEYNKTYLVKNEILNKELLATYISKL